MTASKAERVQQLQKRLEATEARAKQLREQKRRIEQAERAREQAERRRIETRQRILLGAFVLHAMQERPDWAAFQLNGIRLADYLTRPDDRALFGLAPLAGASQAGAGRG